MSLDLNKLFLKEGADLNFFQAVYLLEKYFDGKGRVGTSDDLLTEPFRFETLNTLAFPASDLASIMPPLSFQKQADDIEKGVDKSGPTEETDLLPPLAEILKAEQGPLRIIVTFMGLYGVSSPLPSYFVDPITLKKIEYFELKKFLDIFTHRFYSHFYRAWKKYRHQSQFLPERPDDYTLRMLALTGQWPKRRSKIPNSNSIEHNLRRIPYARFLGNRVRSAKGLQQLLRGYFGFQKVRIHQFRLSWIDIPVKARLGEGIVTLGRSFRLGEQMQDRVSQFLVEIGPMPSEMFNQFLPTEEKALLRALGRTKKIEEKLNQDDLKSEESLLNQVRELIDAYLRDPLEYKIKIVLEPETSVVPTLGSIHARMGMGTWLGERPKGEITCTL